MGQLTPMYRCLADGPRLCVETWRKLGASKRVVGWIKDGVIPKFAQVPVPFNEGDYRTKNVLEVKAWQDTRTKVFLQQGAIAPARSKDYVSASFMIPKKAPGKFRLIADERTINKHTPVPTMKYTTLRNFASLVKPGDFTLSMDLEGGYYQFSIHPEYRKYFVFGVDNEYFEYVGLPMGWNCSPYILLYLPTLWQNLLKCCRIPSH